MADDEAPSNFDVLVKSYLKKGLTREEARLVAGWVEEGKPGLARSRAEQLGEIYLLGYNCSDIQKMFPELPLALLLWSRIEHGWDDLRESYRQTLYEQTLKSALAVRIDALRLLSDFLSASHVKWRRELLTYLAAPDRQPPPKFLPDNINVYNQALAMFENLLKFDKKSGKSANPMDGLPPLVSVDISPEGKKITVKPVTQDDVRRALLHKREPKA